MRGINLKRVVLGGLLGGLLSNILGISLAHFVLRSELMAMMNAAHITSFPLYTPFLHLSTRFATGIVLVWLYAAMRPRFGPGPKTAVLAGVVAWYFSFVLSTSGLLPWGIIPDKVLWVTLPWSLGEMVIVALAGAWVYQEG